MSRRFQAGGFRIEPQFNVYNLTNANDLLQITTRDPMLIGADNCCIEVRPVGVGPLIHTLFVAVYGVHLIENLKLDEIAAAGVGEFAFIVQPLKMQGATGSPVAPTAIR